MSFIIINLGMFSLAGSLEKMLSGHNQSMFEYLARPGQAQAQQAAGPSAAANHFSTLARTGAQVGNANRGGQKNEGFKDIVY